MCIGSIDQDLESAKIQNISVGEPYQTHNSFK